MCFTKDSSNDTISVDEARADDSLRKEEYTMIPLPSLVKRIKQEDTPLPDPFHFPKNYRPDVEACLAAKKMTGVARANLYTTIAHAMYQYKKSPSHDDYVSIARQIIEKHPFLAAKGMETSYVSFFVCHNG